MKPITKMIMKIKKMMKRCCVLHVRVVNHLNVNPLVFVNVKLDVKLHAVFALNPVKSAHQTANVSPVSIPKR